ncbi:serine protease [Grimontia hollisae]|uniref:Trypsin n=1 Tax=Grimontia hollisae TaxID=673 RepID=A0A377HPU0_GRIHO|nr:serine protease [Grimontia hollisae]MDF2185323.1 serine protease [Grimontia hollisae]STO58271.1 Trypsin precursor [Grimontia hollisae]STQ76795.1 Trypsin precursor [Grimontia hollisae]
MGKTLVVTLFMLFSGFSQALEFSPRVVGGTTASISDAPWQAFIRVGSYFCGGVVIAPRWILTAAHCLDTAGDNEKFSLASVGSVSVYTGTAELSGVNLLDFQSAVESVYVNNHYDKNAYVNDIALIKLSTNVHPNAVVITLASSSDQATVDAGANAGNNDLQLSGWGFKDTDRTVDTNTLQKANLSAVSDATCGSLWGTTVTNVSGYQGKYLCALESGIGACNGDSGGPLVWFDPLKAGDVDGGARLVGLVSFGVASQCASPIYPDVYTQVASYLSWIASCQQGNCVAQASTVIGETSGGGNLSLLFYILLAVIFRHLFVLK